MTALWRDLRSMDAADAARGAGALSAGEAALITAWQAPHLRGHVPAANLAVMVPDFLNYARLLNTGQAKTMLGLGGSLPRAFLSGVRALPAVMGSPRRTLSRDFWVIASALLRYDMALLPRGSAANVLLHPYLADFAFAFERRDFLELFARLVRSSGAAPGIFTFQPRACISCLTRWGISPVVLAQHGPPSPEIAPLLALTPFDPPPRILHDISGLPATIQAELSGQPGESLLLVSPGVHIPLAAAGGGTRISE